MSLDPSTKIPPVPAPLDPGPAPANPSVGQHATAGGVGLIAGAFSYWLINKKGLDPQTAGMVVGGVTAAFTAASNWAMAKINQWATAVTGGKS